MLLYDGDCGFCRSWVARLRRWDADHALEFVTARDRHRRHDLPAIDDEALDRAMHLVTPDGHVHLGGRAVGPIVSRLPRARFITVLLGIPLVQRLVDWGYAEVAQRRHRLGCGSADCRWR